MQKEVKTEFVPTDIPLERGDFQTIATRVGKLLEKEVSYWHVYRWYNGLYKGQISNEWAYKKVLTDLHNQRTEIDKAAKAAAASINA